MGLVDKGQRTELQNMCLSSVELGYDARLIFDTFLLCGYRKPCIPNTSTSRFPTNHHCVVHFWKFMERYKSKRYQ